MAQVKRKLAGVLLAAAMVASAPASAQLFGGLLGGGKKASIDGPAAPLAANLADAKPDLGELPSLLGKAYTGQNCNLSFTTAPDGRFKVNICDAHFFLIARGADGALQTRGHGAGTITVGGNFETGPSGFVFGYNTADTRIYLLRDPNGNFDVIMATKKADGMRLDMYAKVIDPTNPQAAAAGAGIGMFYGKKYRPDVEKIVGYSLEDLPGKVKEPSPFGGRVVVAAAEPPMRPAAVAGTNPGQPGKPVVLGPRLALVMGNSLYGPAMGLLKNPVNDARAMAATLRSVGFQVIAVDNADQRAMKRAIIDFGNRLRGLGPGGTGLFYFAGHGVQARGTNYLVPVDARIGTEADIEVEAVAADGVLRQMEEAGVATNIVILDACRNLPVQRAVRDGTRGLARMDAPNGSFMAYYTAPGSVAMDGAGLNSPFATALIAELKKPGQQIEETFRKVRRAVIAQTGGKQVPWDSSSLLEGFVFAPDGSPEAAPAAARPAVARPAVARPAAKPPVPVRRR